MENCSITGFSTALMGEEVNLEVRSTTITDGGVGIMMNDIGGATIEACDILEQRIAGIAAYDVARTVSKPPIVITDNFLVTSFHGWQDESFGIYVERTGQASQLTINREFEIARNTIRGGDFGMYIPAQYVRSTEIVANIVADCDLRGIECVADSIAEDNVELHCNNAFGNRQCNYCNIGAAYPASNIEMDPLFCDGTAGTESSTLRMDSPSASGQNPEEASCGRAGARRVECAWGELALSTTVAEGAEVLVVGDVVVPPTKSLTLEQGVTLTMHQEDLGESGSDEDRVELIVDGDLVVEGGEDTEDRVAIKGATEAVGSWWGIDVGSSGTVTMANADLAHGVMQLVVTAEGTSRVTGCTFSDYEQTALTIGSGDGMDLTVEGNTIYPVDGTMGIQLVSNVDGVTLEGNRIWGDEPMLAGITTFMPAGAPLLAANEVSGFTVSEGITLTGGSSDLVENEVTGNFTGILVTGGTPRIGIGSASDNAITGNEDGIVITGGEPVIRNNRITDNVSWGVRVQDDADPDLGTDTDPGRNTFLDNYYGCIVNENPGGTPAVRAERNYFGVCDGGFPEVCWSGNVDVGNWLCTEPAAARRPGVTRVEDGPGVVLAGARPNPMTTTGGIAFRLDGEGRMVGARVFDVAGRMVREIAGRPYDPGDHVLAWDGLSDEGRPVRTGMYFVRVTVGGEPTGTVKVLVAR